MATDILALCPCGHVACLHDELNGCTSGRSSGTQCACMRSALMAASTGNAISASSLEANEAALIICRAFRWSETKQGSDYWRGVHANLVEIGTGLRIEEHEGR